MTISIARRRQLRRLRNNWTVIALALFLWLCAGVILWFAWRVLMYVYTYAGAAM